MVDFDDLTDEQLAEKLRQAEADVSRDDRSRPRLR